MPSTNKTPNRPAHVTDGSIFDDLGLSPAEALEAKVKADLWRGLVAHIATLGLSQKEIAKELGTHQPEVSHLLNGKISRFSIGTLIQYGARLGLGFQGRFTKPKRQSTLADVHGQAQRSARRRERQAVAA